MEEKRQPELAGNLELAAWQLARATREKNACDTFFSVLEQRLRSRLKGGLPHELEEAMAWSKAEADRLLDWAKKRGLEG